MPRKGRSIIGDPFMQESALDKDECFVLSKGCDYLLRTLDHNPCLDRDILEFACWLLGPRLFELSQELTKSLGKRQARSLQEDLQESMDHDDYARSLIRVVKQDRSKSAKLLRILQRNLKHRQSDLTSGDSSQLKKNVSKFGRLFDLSQEEIELCLFFFLGTGWDQFRRLFHNHLKVEEYSGRKYLLAALDLSKSSLDRGLRGRLGRLGIVAQDRLDLDFNSDFLGLFIDPENFIAQDCLYQKAPKSEIPLSYHMLPSQEVRLLSSLLQEKREQPVHVLFYGPAGTGKTSFARALAHSLQDPAYEILQGDKNKASRRRAALQACLNMTNNSSGSVLIIDESDHLLNTREQFLFQGEVRDKGWLNSFLEEPGVRAIWIVNKTDNIEESVLRRFAYSKYFPHFSRQKRIQLWKTAVKHNKAGRFIKEPAIRRLAEDYHVSAGVIDSAIKQAKASSDMPGLSFTQRLRMALDAHLRLQNQGSLPRKEGLLDRDFTLQGLNIQGSLEHLLNGLRRYEKRRVASSQSAGQFSMLFYGPPGTGKSELAKYLATELDKDLMLKRSSDLLDPYVGMTERHIAEMFAEAEAREAVLVLDEADSFFFGRNMAQRSWEISQVNEFLTRMEGYQGILVCTTNRFQGMDRASVRRFQEKIFFDYLAAEGIEVLFRKFLCPLCKARLEQDSLNRLTSIKGLTPGDFKNVRDMYALQDKRPDLDELIFALEEEVRLKDEQQGKKAGFKLS